MRHTRHACEMHFYEVHALSLCPPIQTASRRCVSGHGVTAPRPSPAPRGRHPLALDTVHLEQVALIVPKYVTRAAGRAEDAVRGQDAKIARVVVLAAAAVSISSTLDMAPGPGLDGVVSCVSRSTWGSIRRCGCVQYSGGGRARVGVRTLIQLPGIDVDMDLGASATAAGMNVDANLGARAMPIPVERPKPASENGYHF